MLGWVTSLHLISGAPNESKWEYLGEPDPSNQPCGNLGACPLGGSTCPNPHQGVHLRKVAIDLEVPLIVVISISEFDTKLD